MKENRVLRSTGNGIATQVCTPSKTNIWKLYFQCEKVVKKLIDAKERDIGVHFEYKHCNIVLELTTAEYLQFAECFEADFSNYDTVDVEMFKRKDRKGKTVEISAIQNLKFNSTMSEGVNGKSHILFIGELKTTVNLISNKSTVGR